MKEAEREQYEEVGEVTNMNREKQEEIGDEMNQLKMDFNFEKNDIKREKATSNLDLTSLQLDAMNALTVANDDTLNLRETAEEEKSSAEERLNELIGETEQKLME